MAYWLAFLFGSSTITQIAEDPKDRSFADLINKNFENCAC